MAKIPVRTATRGLETGGTPQYSSSSPLAGAFANLGDTVMDVASEYQRQQESIEDFDANQRFEQMKIRANGQLPDIVANAPASGQGIHQNAMDVFEKQANEFLESVPERLRPRFQTLTQTAREQWANTTAADELQQRSSWYRTNIDTSTQEAQNQVYNDPAQFDAARDQVFRAIDSSGLPQAEKEELRRKAESTISLGVANREITNAQNDPNAIEGAAERLGVVDVGPLPREVNTRAQMARDHFVQLGYTPEQAAGIVGNLVQESGVRPSGAVGDSGTAFGVAQWRGERLNRLKRFAASGGRSWEDLSTQLDFIHMELQTSEKSAGDQLKRATTIEEAAAAFVSFERPQGWTANNPRGGHGWTNRLAAAQKVAGVPVTASGEVAPDPRYANLPLDQRLDIYSKMQAAATRGQTALDAQTKAYQTQTNDNYRLRIATGDTSLSERDILRDPVLDEGQKATLINSYKEAMEDSLAVAQGVELLRSGSLGTAVDPYADKGRKLVDKIYERTSPLLPDDQKQPLVETVVQQTGVVPQPVLNDLRRGLSSTAPADVASAAQYAQRLAAIDPAALTRREGGSEVQKSADDFSFMVNKLNMSPSDAAQRIIDNRNPEKQFARKALEPAAKEFIKAVEQDDLASTFDESFLPFNDPELGINPAQEAGIKAEYLAIAEDQFYQANGDAELAKNRAVEEMKRLYGVTEIGGVRTVMKHPPERFWPKLPEAGFLGFEGDPLGYAKKQLQDDILSFGSEVDPNTVRLVTTPETDAMVKRGELPAYAVLYKDANGVYQTIPGKLWRPDVDPATVRAKAAEQEQERTQVLDRARDVQAETRSRIETNALPDAGRAQSLDAFLDGPVQMPPPPGRETTADRLQERRDELFENAPEPNSGGGW